MSLRLDQTIVILSSHIPVREGTKLHMGFQELSSCNGKTYRYFRTLSICQSNKKTKRFSPSAVRQLAEAKGFARFEDRTVTETASTTKIEKIQTDSAAAPRQKTEEEIFPALNDVLNLIIDDGVRLDLPGIYAWKIEGIGTYVGKYKHKNRPLKEYNRNVSRLLRREAYRPQKPDGFRRIHRALERAVKDGLRIDLRILENCSEENINERERYYISEMSEGDLNG